MKLQIENPIILIDENPTPLFVFNEIVEDCLMAKNLDRLRRLMEQTFTYKLSFTWGFGHNHFWLKQINNKSDKRILIVTE